MTNEQTSGSAIRTPDQRLRVFVSSTLAELADERAAVAEAISVLRLTPVLFELGARPHPPRELYRAYLAQSDIFIGLYWQRYGWIGPDMDISGLEDEFRLSGSLPRLIYVKAPAPEREPGLTAMIEQLQTEGTESYRSFRDAEELDRLVRDDLALLLSERFTATPAAPHDEPKRTRSMPISATSLVGREQDIAAVSKLLGAPDVRLVTITGAGGIGKTRLAIAVGDALQPEFPGGAAFASLASVSEPELVMPRIATALDAAVEGSRPALDVIVESIADSRMLLVLDNLEQVIGVAPELDELLARCPGLTILATSRSALRLRAEHEYPVGALEVPPTSDHAAGAVAGCSAVQLFVDRAQAVRYDFALTAKNALAIAEICRRLDGLPLAIELAAARVRLLAPVALLARLETSLDALGTGPVDLPDRQRTLRATVDWSIGLLGDAEREMLATLSVFVDGWALEAAAPVTDVPEDVALDLLDSLAGHSLVTIDAIEAGLRFRMLESVRELATELSVTSGGRAEAEQRHARYFHDLVKSIDWPAGRQSDLADRLRVEDENVRATIRWFLAHDVRPLPHMFRSLWLFWQLRDRMPDASKWIAELIEQIDRFDSQSKVELLLTSALTAVEVGDDEGALSAVEALERLEEPIEDPFLENSAHLAVAWILPIEDDFEGALRSALAAYDGYLAQNESIGAAGSAMSAGMVSMNLGRSADARRYFAEVDRLAGQSGNDWLELGTRTQLAMLAVAEADLDEARRLVVASVDVDDSAELGTYTLAFALVAFAQLALAEGHPVQAATALGAADGLRARAGVRAWPSARRSEAELVAKVRHALGASAYHEAFESGSQLTSADAVALVRGDS